MQIEFSEAVFSAKRIPFVLSYLCARFKWKQKACDRLCLNPNKEQIGFAFFSISFFQIPFYYLLCFPFTLSFCQISYFFFRFLLFLLHPSPNFPNCFIFKWWRIKKIIECKICRFCILHFHFRNCSDMGYFKWEKLITFQFHIPRVQESK